MELKDTPLEGVWERGVRIVESKEAIGVDNDDSRDCRCRVWSQTHREVHHDVHNTRDGWRCRCESYRLGHKIVCKHMMAAFMLAASGPRQSKKKTGASSELPERWCRHCGSTDAAWSESRPLRRMSAPEGTGVDRHICGTCGRRFADRPCFEGRHYLKDVILYAIRLVAGTMLPKDAARTAKDEKVEVPGRTIQRWVDEHPRMAAAFARDLEMTGGDGVGVDEKHYKPGGKPRWMARAICMATVFIPPGDHWPDKLNHDATPLPEKVVEQLGGPPLLPLSDRLGGYRKGYDSTMRTEPRPVTMHVPDAAVNNRHVNNNRHERHNGDTERRKKDSRGFDSDVPGLFVLDEAYHHNFLRPHTGLGGLTPAEKAALQYRGPTGCSPWYGAPRHPALTLPDDAAARPCVRRVSGPAGWRLTCSITLFGRITTSRIRTAALRYDFQAD